MSKDSFGFSKSERKTTMKNNYITFILIFALLFSSAPILLAAERAAQIPVKTLADFQKEYSGTKPIVAWNKYHEYLALQKAPKATLESSRMRVEYVHSSVASGTKDVVAFLKRGDENRKSAGELYPSTREFRPASRVSGTKDIVVFTQ